MVDYVLDRDDGMVPLKDMRDLSDYDGPLISAGPGLVSMLKEEEAKDDLRAKDAWKLYDFELCFESFWEENSPGDELEYRVHEHEGDKYVAAVMITEFGEDVLCLGVGVSQPTEEEARKSAAQNAFWRSRAHPLGDLEKPLPPQARDWFSRFVQNDYYRADSMLIERAPPGLVRKDEKKSTPVFPRDDGPSKPSKAEKKRKKRRAQRARKKEKAKEARPDQAPLDFKRHFDTLMSNPDCGVAGEYEYKLLGFNPPPPQGDYDGARFISGVFYTRADVARFPQRQYHQRLIGVGVAELNEERSEQSAAQNAFRMFGCHPFADGREPLPAQERDAWSEEVLEDTMYMQLPGVKADADARDAARSRANREVKNVPKPAPTVVRISTPRPRPGEGPVVVKLGGMLISPESEDLPGLLEIPEYGPKFGTMRLKLNGTPVTFMPMTVQTECICILPIKIAIALGMKVEATTDYAYQSPYGRHSTPFLGITRDVRVQIGQDTLLLDIVPVMRTWTNTPFWGISPFSDAVRSMPTLTLSSGDGALTVDRGKIIMTSRFPNKRSPLIRFAEPIMPGCMSTPLLREWPYYPKTDQSMYGMVARSWKWPPPSSAVSDEQENAFVKRCFPKPRAEFGRRAMDLNHEKYSSICNLADNVGLTHIQGMSLRRQVMRHANAYSGQPINDNQMFGFDDDMKLIKDAAFKFEECVSDFFIAEHKFQRIKRAYDPHVDRFPAFSTEDDLKAMQKSGAMGDCKITPDLLFHTPVYINGRKIHWIDCKGYYGFGWHKFDKRMIQGRLIAQAEKYTAAFGFGAIVYRYGFSPSLVKPLEESAILLDASVCVHTAVLDDPSLTYNPLVRVSNKARASQVGFIDVYSGRKANKRHRNGRPRARRK